MSTSTRKRRKCGCTDPENAMTEFGKARNYSDGTIQYPKKGREPPPDIDGFKRDPTNAWRFLPLWEGCPNRFQSQLLKPCGALGVLTICQHPDGPKENESRVNFATCSSCTLSK